MDISSIVALHRFDWGIFKPWGDAIFGLTIMMFAAVLLITAAMLRNLWRDRRSWVLPTIGTVLFMLMFLMTAASVGLQFTSIHHQEYVHVPTTATLIVGCLSITAMQQRHSRQSA